MSSLYRLDKFSGRLIASTNVEYEHARLVENAAFDPRPVLIARVRDAADVELIIDHCRAEGLPLAVRSGGHSLAGHSTGDGGVVIDLGDLDELEIDRAARTAWAGSGVRAARYTQAAWTHGLATSFGDTGSVGLGGLVLGGGIGWLVRRHGLTIDSLLAVEIVTATGDRLVASADEHADLFWAVRGGGGNFGVVTRFKFALHPISAVLHGTILLPATRDALSEMATYGIGAADELTLMPTVMAIPPIDEVPAEFHGQPGLFIDLLWAGERAAGERALRPLRDIGRPLLDTIALKPYPEVYPEPSGERTAWTASTIFLREMDDTTADIVMRHVAEAPPGDCLAHLRVLGGAAGRVPAGATAYGWRDRSLLLWIIADYGQQDGDAPERYRRWAEGFRLALAERGDGAFVSFMAAGEAAETAYPPVAWARLREIKRVYDQDNLFRLNHNIPPAAG